MESTFEHFTDLNSFLLVLQQLLESSIFMQTLANHMLYTLYSLKGTKSALSLRDVSTDSETFLQNLEALLTWVSEIEELTANQKPPSSEVKVVKAQLQEQKVGLKHYIT